MIFFFKISLNYFYTQTPHNKTTIKKQKPQQRVQRCEYAQLAFFLKVFMAYTTESRVHESFADKGSQ